MLYRIMLGAATLAASLAAAGAQIVDYSKYPDLKGQWNRVVVPGVGGMPSFDQTSPGALGRRRR